MGAKRMFALRWFAVLPGSIIASLYCQILVLLFGLILPLTEPALTIVLQLIGQSLCGYYFVYTGCLIAPSHRKPVAASLLSLWVVIGAVLIYFGLARPQFFPELSLGWLIVIVIAGLAAGGMAASRVFVESKDEIVPAPEARFRWYAPITRVGLFTALVGYTFGYLGQPVFYFALAWDDLRRAWWSFINPLFDLGIILVMLTSPSFWLLLVLATVCYFLSNWLSKKLEESSINREPAQIQPTGDAA